MVDLFSSVDIPNIIIESFLNFDKSSRFMYGVQPERGEPSELV